MSLTTKEAFAKLPAKLHRFFLKYPPRPFKTYSEKPSTIDDPSMNPFLPNKNPVTGRWQEPKYSLRRSSDLFKLSYKFGISDLIPPLPKEFYQDKYDNKNFMRGMLRFKKHKWERTMEDRVEARTKAIKDMDDIIVKQRPEYKKIIKKRRASERTWW